MTSTVLISLFGGAACGAIGATATLLTQGLSRKAAKRQERKELILTFLKAAQDVEQAAELRYQKKPLPEDTLSRTHQMWFCQKGVELVCSAKLNGKAVAYGNRMIGALDGQLPAGMPVWDYLKECRRSFLAAARKDLGLRQPRSDFAHL